MTPDELKKLIRNIPDFPQPGILFRDITPLLSDAHGLGAVVDQIAEPWLGKVDRVLGIESRGFIFGAPVAYRLGVGLTIARKPGKLPFQTVVEDYDLEYGSASLHIHADSFEPASRVLVVDDLLATGGMRLHDRAESAGRTQSARPGQLRCACRIRVDDPLRVPGPRRGA
jgi:adenine phosphoribosyltransferase